MADINSQVQHTWRAICERDKPKLKPFYGNFCAIDNYSVKFRRQHQFGDYIADFYCHEGSLVIECDGSVHDQNDQWHHDQGRDAYMISNGLRVLRFTNEQILDDPEMVLKEISKFLTTK